METFMSGLTSIRFSERIIDGGPLLMVGHY